MAVHRKSRPRHRAEAFEQSPVRAAIAAVARRGVIGAAGAGLALGVIAVPGVAVDPDAAEAESAAGTVNAADAAESSTASTAVLDIARQYVGTPYVWGGATPAGFDCSGFTMHVFAQVGIYLPRTSGEQRYAGQVVSAAEAQPGDLVWWPGHVGIYTGNGQHIAARNPSTLLHESPIWRADPTFIRVG